MCCFIRRSRLFYESLSGHVLTAQQLASLIYGTYTGLIYATPWLGGWIADSFLGQRKTAMIGIIAMAFGHFMMASEALLFPALTLLIFGGGFFKTNTSSQVGMLYQPGDPRRDRGYAIFYVGVNIGSFFAPLVCGTLGEEVGWHYGFGAAGVGMLIGLATYIWRAGTACRPKASNSAAPRPNVSQAEPRRMEIGRRADGADHSPDPVVGLLRAAGQHHRALCRRQYRPPPDPGPDRLADSRDMVPGLQSFHDLRLHALADHLLDAPGADPERAQQHVQDRDRLPPDGGRPMC